MQLTLRRTHQQAARTFGELLIEGVFQCYTLEDPVRLPGVKVPGQTAIPAGAYELQWTYSPRFKTNLPLVKDVPGFEGVRIHAGNSEADTEGCILVGSDRTQDRLVASRLALAALLQKIEYPATLTVKNVGA